MELSTDDDQTPAPWLRFTVLLVLGSLALSLPALLSGLLWDDYFFTGRLIQGDSPFTYYDFSRSLTDRDMAPWWISPEHQIRFYRPLASLTLHLDFSVMGASPLFAHLHSAVWFVMLLLGAVRLLRTWLPVRTAKGAAVIFALGAGHAFTVGWISARHAVMSGAFCVWSLVYYLCWRQQGARRHAVIALGLLGLGLLSSETALAVAGVVLAYELAGAEGTLRSRLAAAAPTLGMAALYGVLYKAAGYGSRGSALYTDPIGQPVDFLAGLVPKIVAVFSTFVFGVHTSSAFRPGQRWIPLIAGALGLSLVAAGLLLCWRRFDPIVRRRIRWLGLATLFGLGPSLASHPSGRSTVLPSLTFAAVACLLLKGLYEASPQRLLRIGRLAVGALLGFGLLVVSPASRLGTSEFLRRGSKAELTLGTGSKPNCRPDTHYVLLNGGLLFSLHAPFILATHQSTTWRGWHQLTEPTSDIVVERTGKSSLRITSRRKPLVNALMMHVFRPRTDDLTAGRIIQTRHVRARVLKSVPRGPIQMEFTIPGLHDPARVCVLYYDGKAGVLRNASLPPAGQRLTIRWHKPLI